MKSRAYIISNYSSQNELLANYLSKKNNLLIFQKKYQELPELLDTQNHFRKILLLYDWLRNDYNLLWQEFNQLTATKNKNVYCSVLNLEKNPYLIKDILYCGVRGVFFESDSLELIEKGIISILQGELWFSREILAECLMEKNYCILKALQVHNNNLTNREKEILNHIVSGQKNHEIAKSLGVSVHTVKTHVYKLFQKIHVSCRSEASLWALKNSSYDLVWKKSDGEKDGT